MPALAGLFHGLPHQSDVALADPLLSNAADGDDGAGGVFSGGRTGGRTGGRLALSLLFVIQVLDWCALMAHSYYVTAWLGFDTKIGGSFHVAFVALAAQGGVAVLTALYLDRMNKQYGVKRVWYLAALSFSLMLAATGHWGGSGTATRRWLAISFSAATGVGFTVCNNNGYLLVEELDPDKEHGRGLNLAIALNAMPVAQVIIASSAGPAIAALGGGSSSASPLDQQRNEEAIGNLFVIAGLAITLLLLAAISVDWSFRVIPVR